MATLPFPTKLLGLVLVGWLFIYTLSLVRSKKLNAQMAVSWVITELVIFGILIFNNLLNSLMILIGETNISSIIYVILFAWLVSLMLDILIRVSSLYTKLYSITQELGLLKEHFESLQLISKGSLKERRGEQVK